MCCAVTAALPVQVGNRGTGQWGLWVPVSTKLPQLCCAPEGDVVRVLADVAPRTPLYAVLPQPLGLTVSGSSLEGHTPTGGGGLGDSRTPGMGQGFPSSSFLQFTLRNRNTPLTLTRRGLVLAPDKGFDPYKDTQVGTSSPRLVTATSQSTGA